VIRAREKTGGGFQGIPTTPTARFALASWSANMSADRHQPTTKTAQIRLTRSSPAYWRITFDNPPLNLLGPEFVLEFREIMSAIETDDQVKVVVFESAVEGFFLNHSDFLAKFEDLTGCCAIFLSAKASPSAADTWRR
jgi:hypothetical protein